MKPLSQSLLRPSHLWGMGKMSSSWKFLMPVNPLPELCSQSSIKNWPCGLLLPRSHSTYAEGWEYPALFDPLLLQREVIPCPCGFPQWCWYLPSFSPSSHVRIFGLAELHARDALPTPFARQHLLNTLPVKWSQWILLCVRIHRIQGEKKKKKTRTCPCLWVSP